MSDSRYEIPNDDTVSSSDIQPEADLRKADLSEASLNGANLAGSDLFDADLSGANLLNAKLSDAKLSNADLSGATLSDSNLSGAMLSLADLSEARSSDVNLSKAYLAEADLSNANLTGSNLSGALLMNADLSEADLRGTNLSEATFSNITLTGATISRRTEIDAPRGPIKQYAGDDASIEQLQDTVARANGELRAAYSANGLLDWARTARIRERRARRKEAKAEGGLQGYKDWLLSCLSRVFAGYGVRLAPVAVWMLLLWLLSAGVYWNWGRMSWDRSLYYSVITVTTSPPETPPSGLSTIVAGVEAFVGTAAIVFLGYILGSREQI
ncbi:pentapeptide repeat-containing protein [Haloarcula marismortui]|jgi:hypothetical protein|uniref:Pentapeptide repeat-containing protein n=1 Tax=Haloarcula marismortui ATCC 33799 TaxID=662475 RepID=M0JKR7_9EURY|nr:pentapeptide repeat-containing protein [Haloarcula californiae]EMA09591.1 pentapeptide repeat-containing protein [Haloarcula californiae ATCC 33799]